jgi:hypothetical protein
VRHGTHDSRGTPPAKPRIMMKSLESGKAGWALLWLLGIPLPVLLIAYLFSKAC